MPPTARIRPCFPGNRFGKRTTDIDRIITEIDYYTTVKDEIKLVGPAEPDLLQFFVEVGLRPTNIKPRK